MEADARRAGGLLCRHPIAVGVALIVAFGLLSALVSVAGILLLGFMALLIATLLTYPIDLLSRAMPRALALVITLVATIALMIGVALLVVPVVSAEAVRLGQELPAALDHLSQWSKKIGNAAPSTGAEQDARIAQTLRDVLSRQVASLLSAAVPIAFTALASTSVLVLILALAFFLAYAPDSYKKGLRALVPEPYEPLFDETWRRIGTSLKHWVGGILVAMVTMGVFTATGLYFAGVDSWFTLGVLTFVGTAVPYVGAIASAIPGLAVGLTRSPETLFYVLCVYVGVHIVEAYIVEPFIMRSAVKLRPGTLLLWQAIMGSLFGLPGIITATPLLVCIKEAVGYLYVERTLGKSEAEPPLEGHRS